MKEKDFKEKYLLELSPEKKEAMERKIKVFEEFEKEFNSNIFSWRRADFFNSNFSLEELFSSSFSGSLQKAIMPGIGYSHGLFERFHFLERVISPYNLKFEKEEEKKLARKIFYLLVDFVKENPPELVPEFLLNSFLKPGGNYSFSKLFDSNLEYMEKLFQFNLLNERYFEDVENVENTLILESKIALEVLQKAKLTKRPLIIFNPEISLEEKTKILKQSYRKKDIHLYQDIIKRNLKHPSELIPFIEATIIENNRCQNKEDNVRNIFHRIIFKTNFKELTSTNNIFEEITKKYEKYLNESFFKSEISSYASSLIENNIKAVSNIYFKDRPLKEKLIAAISSTSDSSFYGRKFYSISNPLSLLPEAETKEERDSIFHLYLLSTSFQYSSFNISKILYDLGEENFKYVLNEERFFGFLEDKISNINAVNTTNEFFRVSELILKHASEYLKKKFWPLPNLGISFRGKDNSSTRQSNSFSILSFFSGIKKMSEADNSFVEIHKFIYDNFTKELENDNSEGAYDYFMKVLNTDFLESILQRRIYNCYGSSSKIAYANDKGELLDVIFESFEKNASVIHPERYEEIKKNIKHIKSSLLLLSSL